jgi:hypothetical protein
LIKAKAVSFASTAVITLPGDSTPLLTTTDTFFHTLPTKPDEGVTSREKDAQDDNCVGASKSICGYTSPPEVTSNSFEEEANSTLFTNLDDDARLEALLVLDPIRPDSTVTESPGSIVDPLLRVMIKCDESRQKHRVEDAP